MAGNAAPLTLLHLQGAMDVAAAKDRFTYQSAIILMLATRQDWCRFEDIFLVYSADLWSETDIFFAISSIIL